MTLMGSEPVWGLKGKTGEQELFYLEFYFPGKTTFKYWLIVAVNVVSLTFGVLFIYND